MFWLTADKTFSLCRDLQNSIGFMVKGLEAISHGGWGGGAAFR